MGIIPRAVGIVTAAASMTAGDIPSAVVGTDTPWE